ncbi:MAG: 1-(5-phosphoribosyl)-5-[(5-phosphoribosylamino)methylideneamino]imidazole-4-carboxamide isomerase [Candidatus Omnitrophica bacterium CG1_02_49_10]|nr:MAG: 1-(5-phosphoribosyl)-5-[(5-phosphoribosylamino)methylideneamino]imidazole-4-carboxamide isomerase [Candidatus Omnitrophica bacterium CG1_02_49_10]
MLILPAIDIIGGKVVRLNRGDFATEKVYSDDPVEVAKRWAAEGAEAMHLVDLDGAKAGVMKNLDTVSRIRDAVDIFLELGGGIRRREDVEKVLNEGIDRAVIGTSACKDEALLKDLIRDFDDKIIVSIDSKNGSVAIDGWQDSGMISTVEFAKRLEGMGISALIFTDISRDGMLSGPNIAAIKELLNVVDIPVISSGGVSSIDDIKKIKTREADGVAGVIIGKALYESRIDLKEALGIC